jgi:glucosamine kinase
MSYWMGIDGGGSHLRVAITADDLTILTQVMDSTANPNIVGHDLASERVRNAFNLALSQAGLKPEDLMGIGVGIAGASATHSAEWLQSLTDSFAPGIPVALSSDLEIALVGACGERRGVLILAGTGSAAYGINETGESVQVGGWGYLISDEGGSYWIGRHALQLLTRHADGRQHLPVTFVKTILEALDLTAVSDLIPWLYHSRQSRNREIASLAPIVLQYAEQVESVLQIVDFAAQELMQLHSTVVRRLKMADAQVAFAGGLLENDNALSKRLCELLRLNKRPIPKYSAVIGAALLAQITTKDL